MINDEKFIKGLAKGLQASQVVQGLAEMRKFYDAFEDISMDETYTPEEREEAKRLVEGGFYKFISRMNMMAGR